jgi:probable phosphoglycerate mutase
MPTVLLIRHGHVEGIAPERFRGRLDLPLTALGRRQAQAVAAYVLRHWPEARAVYASPLSRCQETAAAIATALHCDVQTKEGLADLDFGAWQGLTPAEVATRWPALVDRWFAAPHRVRIPGGESLLDLAARASHAFAACLDTLAGDATIAIVAHDHVNRALLCEILGLPLAQYWRLRQDPCCVNVIEAGTEFRVTLLNATDHLPGGAGHADGTAADAGADAG